MNAEQAIERSITHNEIVTIDSTKDDLEHLLYECEDSVDANGVWEFWGSPRSDAMWRVHVKGPIWWAQDAGQRVPLAARTEKAARAEIQRSTDWTEPSAVVLVGPAYEARVEVG